MPRPHARLRQSSKLRSRGRELLRAMFEPIDAGLLVFFRVSFGLLMAWEASRYLTSRFRQGGLDRAAVSPARSLLQILRL